MTGMAPTTLSPLFTSRQLHPRPPESASCCDAHGEQLPTRQTQPWLQIRFHWRNSMPHIELPENMPGITAGLAFRPESAKPLRELAHVLLHTSGNAGFSSADRELIASFVSSRNTCSFCQRSHGAAATHLYGGD